MEEVAEIVRRDKKVPSIGPAVQRDTGTEENFNNSPDPVLRRTRRALQCGDDKPQARLRLQLRPLFQGIIKMFARRYVTGIKLEAFSSAVRSETMYFAYWSHPSRERKKHCWRRRARSRAGQAEFVESPDSA